MKTTKMKLIILGLLAVIIILLFEHFDLAMYLSVDGFNRYHQQILAFKQANLMTCTLIYVLSYILLIAACIPGTILLDLLAGFLYQPWYAILLVLISYSSGAILNFLLVRYVFKGVYARRFSHLRHLLGADDATSSATALNLIGLRLVPIIPFWLINILAAIIKIPLWLFIWTTFIGIIPTSLIYVLIGNGLHSQIGHHQPLSMAMLTDPKLWGPLLVLALFILVPNCIKIYTKAKAKRKGMK